MGIIVFTGHRKFGGQYINPGVGHPVYEVLANIVSRAVAKGFDAFISGGAIGTDQLAAQVVIDLDFADGLTIARPFPSQSCKWPQRTQAIFDDICDRAANVVDVSPDPYSPAKMQVRNQWMVDRADVVVAVYDGSRGGTANCIEYARAQGKPVLLLDPNTLVERWLR